MFTGYLPHLKYKLFQGKESICLAHCLEPKAVPLEPKAVLSK